MSSSPAPSDRHAHVAAQDRFICRREGHVPSLSVTQQNATTEKGATYLTTCARCFKVYEEVMPDAR